MESFDDQVFEEEPTSQFNGDFNLLHRIHTTVLDMLSDRGYQVTKQESETLDLEAFKAYYKAKKPSGNLKEVLQVDQFNSIVHSLTEIYYSMSKQKYIYVRYIEHVPKEDGSKKEKEIGGDVIDTILGEISELMRVYRNQIANIILVIPQKISNHGVTSFQNLKYSPVTIFHYKELLFNITKHFFMPSLP